MLKNIPYKKKNKVLLAAIILAVLFVYSFTIKKTILLISDVKDAERKAETAKDIPSRSALLNKEIEKIDSRIGTQTGLADESRQSLLEMVTGYCRSNNAVLREFPEATEATQGSFIVATNRFEVEGNFSVLLSFVYMLERKSSPGKVASVNYTLKKNTKTKEMALTATIYLQNIKKQ
ncbi:MAG: hypothetical protein JWO44_1639 [Bacteroidetes bacterium]|nr:hypothetical protein [Bacteroidota bacterium]